MISLFMQGGPSHIDLFDPKPELTKRDGRTSPATSSTTTRPKSSAKLLGSPWKFAQHGQCGMELSRAAAAPGRRRRRHHARPLDAHRRQQSRPVDLRPEQRPLHRRPAGARLVADLRPGQREPGPAGLRRAHRPAGLPVLGVDNWSNGWLPSLYQGTVVRPQEPRILNLDPPPPITAGAQERFLNYLQQLNQRAPGRSIRARHDLEARIASYELAARMQTAAKEALDISQETAETHRLYGLDDPETKDWGARCLIARRLVERGVRFVQIPCGNQHWDHHGGIQKSLPLRCKQTDQPTAALVNDLSSAACLTRRSSTGAARWAGCRSFRTRRTSAATTTPTAFSLAGRRRLQGRLRPRRDRRVRPQGGRERRQPLRLPRHAAAPLRPGAGEAVVPARQRHRLAARRPAGAGGEGTAGVVAYCSHFAGNAGRATCCGLAR